MENSLSLSFDNTEDAFVYKSDKALKKSYRIFSLMRCRILVKSGSVLAPVALRLKLPIKNLIRKTIFQQFVGGETLNEVAKTAAGFHQYSVECILDYGIEASKGEENYEKAVEEIQKTIRYAASQKDIPMISVKITGLSNFQLLEKYHGGNPLTEEEQQEWHRLAKRIDKICQTAHHHNIHVLIDAEESWIQKAIDSLAYQMMERYNREKVIIYNTFQLYLRDRLAAMKLHWKRSQKKDYLMGIKLVRGAYMEKERKRAAEKGNPSPIQPDKSATDRDYNEAISWGIDHLDSVSLFIGTHNEESCMFAARLLHNRHIPHHHPHVHFSQLYGMSDHITFNLSRSGYNASKYLPFGPIDDVLPYLIRRSKENSAISGQMGRDLHLLKKEIQRRKQTA